MSSFICEILYHGTDDAQDAHGASEMVLFLWFMSEAQYPGSATVKADRMRLGGLTRNSTTESAMSTLHATSSHPTTQRSVAVPPLPLPLVR